MSQVNRVGTDIDDKTLARIFLDGRSYNSWTDEGLSSADLRRIYELAKWGPTTSNSNPGRFLFIHSPAGKERLRPLLSPGNVDKTMAAPCTAIVAWDIEFYEKMPQLFPSRDVRSVFAGKPDLIAETGFRSSTLQGAYFMFAARAMGFDCGPMSGFDSEGIDREFLAERKWKSNFLCNLGFGRPDGLFPRNPRLDYDEACAEA
jgi:3-hydroxypropanoate dehydrogenase